ncbi:MAG TPA: class I SAM-dependent methyltransferase [Caulobacteraceae bacterium]|jgi:SAM-dependent methyltransferase|nr:class I SAM-dependent methyltransferase [Caulobacteraceae bacterium]
MGTAKVQGPLWGDRARAWADLQEVAFEPLYREAFAAAGLEAGAALLDIGCGSGLAVAIAQQLGAQASGLDASEQLIEIARSRAPGADLRVGELEDLPFDDAAFDIVTGFNSFQYAADRVNGLRQAARVMRSDGRLVAAVWGQPEACEMAGYLAALGPLMPPPPPGAPGPWALSPPGALEALAAEAGLEAVGAGVAACVFRFDDDVTAMEGMLASGPAVRAVQTSGEAAVSAAIAGAIAPYRTPGGGYTLTNAFRYIIARRA